MKIYLIASAPGNEGKRSGILLPVPRRLLSYYMIKIGGMDTD